MLDEALPSYEEASCADASPDQISVVVPEPVLPLGKHHEAAPEMLFDVDALEAAVLDHALAAPIEDWMTFLHPDQVRLVRRLGAGPARVRGPAGTGKTVVALHRAAFLAESLPGPILFTTFVTTLPPVLAALYERLSPTAPGRVEFVNLHAWASALLRSRGCRPRVDPRFTDSAFSRAWGRHGRARSSPTSVFRGGIGGTRSTA